MYNDDDISGSFNNLGAPYGFPNQVAVTNAMASGQNIDWAQLAQQWIQMRDSTSTAVEATDISAGEDGGTSLVGTKYEEKGEADMDMDEEEIMEERSAFDRNKRNSTSAAIMQHPPDTPNRPWYTDKTLLSNTESRTVVSSQKANQWSNTQPLLQTNCDPHVVHRQANSTSHIPSLLSINVPNPNEIRAMPDNPNEQSMMDAAKRKALPAWIREGLEKMEREKQKQHEMLYKEEICDDSDNSSPVHFKVATVNSLNLERLDDDDDIETVEPPEIEQYNESATETVVSAENDVYKSYEQKLSELMVIVRRTLTELLLEVTNEEIGKVACETVKSYKMKGLAAYDDSSSAESSDDNDDEKSPAKKAFPSDSGSDSEEDIKNTVRSKRRAFAKIATEIEERVAAAAAKEEEKLKFFSSQEETNTSAQKQKSVEAEAKETLVTSTSAGSSGKLFERDTGETTETMLQTLNGKLQKERGPRKERTTRFSDNRDKKYLAIAASASYIREMQSTDSIINAASSQSLTGLVQAPYKPMVLPSSISATAEAVSELYPKPRTAPSPEKNSDRDNDKRQTYSKKTQRQRSSRDSSPGSQSSSSSTSSSSTSSELDSSTTNSSDNSRYSNKSRRKHTSRVSNTDQSKAHRQSQMDKRDERKYHSSYADKGRDSYHSRYRSDRPRSRSRSRSRHSRHRHGSYDSDKEYSRRKHDSRYSSSHSHSRNSSHRYQDYSTSNSRSSYSSSSNRRH